MRKHSIALGVAGGLLPTFGVFRLVTELDAADLFVLVVWLAAAVVLHDGLIAPITVGTGVALACRSAKTPAFGVPTLVTSPTAYTPGYDVSSVSGSTAIQPSTNMPESWTT